MPERQRPSEKTDFVFSDGLLPLSRVCGAATHAVWIFGKRADSLGGRERVRRRGATHPTSTVVIPAQVGILFDIRQYFE
ncbi:hypothetical protein HMPREF9123_1546 [Neisseria bacilliformis ATCC BAA-1200]|uniref:Uncharacterized protein n=1 Tax=Neisseria bacilliformis ATCC BAA-1200 TaxID=888742 RepID=F2BCU1_9NEIS|nr:hypothetical protein HMPREF9123_1546 [Neisseria bacilliformis ATCC BAA-1200]